MGRAITYGTRGLGDADRKVIEHVREFGHVTNATLQRMFDIHVFTARDLLSSLRRQGILEKLDQARAGKGVRYGPGPRFPGPRG
jgi:ATP-dependent DNA helicase RecG